MTVMHLEHCKLKSRSLPERRKANLYLQTSTSNNKQQRHNELDEKPTNQVALPSAVRKTLRPGKLLIDSTEITVTQDDLIAVKDLKKGRLSRHLLMKVKGRDNTILSVKQSRLINDAELYQMCDRDCDRIDREIAALRNPSCPATLLTLYGFLFTREEFWICTEQISVSLDQFYVYVIYSLGRRLEESFIAEVASVSFGALKYLEDNISTYHRDVKPTTFYITRSGDVKLANFGIMNFGQHSIRGTSSNVVGQRRPYVSPERLTSTSSKHCDKADIWSAGLTLMELALGRFPYLGFSKMSVFEQLERIVYGAPPQLTDEYGYSGELRQMINSCLIHDSTHRPSLSMMDTCAYIRRHRESPNANVKEYVTEILAVMDFIEEDKRRRDVENASDGEL